MSCKFSFIPIGMHLIADIDSETCLGCSYVWNVTAELIYEGHKELDGITVDAFKYVVPMTCPECGRIATHTGYYCGGLSMEVGYVVELFQEIENDNC